MGCASSRPPARLPERIDLPLPQPDARSAWRACTLKTRGADGFHVLQVDNSLEIVRVKLEPSASAAQGAPLIAELEDGEKVLARVGQRYEYAKATRLLVLHAGRLHEAEVVERRRACRHALRLAVGAVEADLNELNHCVLRLPAAAYESCRRGYCASLARELATVEDAITGNSLELGSQLIYLTIGAAGGGEHAAVSTVAELARALCAPSPARMHGTQQKQDFLLAAEAGSGKTWSVQQLALLLARALQHSREAVPLVPLLIPVQRLALLLRAFASTADAAHIDLVCFYIDHAYTGDERRMLQQAYALRALLPLLDGIDEGAGLKHAIEDFVLRALVPCGFRVVVTSRPEGVQLQRYREAFTVITLRRLSDAQQSELVLKQIGHNDVFWHLSALARLRRAQPHQWAADSTHLPFFAAKYGEMYGAGLLEALERAIVFFDEASGTPVLLSLLALAFTARPADAPLPTSRLELYRLAAEVSVRRHIFRPVIRPDGSAAVARLAADAGMVLSMLCRVASAAHAAAVREFDDRLLRHAFKGSAAAEALWRLLDSHVTGVPLIKTLERAVDPAGLSRYQFKHLSFQEGLFALSLVDGRAPKPASLLRRGAGALLNDAWFANSFRIGGAPLGPPLAAWLDGTAELHLARAGVAAMVALEWHALRGALSLRRLSVDRDALDEADLARLLALLDCPANLPTLAALRLDGQLHAAFDKQLAVRLARLVDARGLNFCCPFPLRLRGALTDVDAVLLAVSVGSSLVCPHAKKSLEQLLGGRDWPSRAYAAGQGAEGHVRVRLPRAAAADDDDAAAAAADDDDASLGEQLRAVGCGVADVGALPAPLLLLGGVFSLRELLAAGHADLAALVAEDVSLEELLVAGATLKELLHTGFSYGVLREAGVPEETLLIEASRQSFSIPLRELWVKGEATAALVAVHPDTFRLFHKAGAAEMSLRWLQKQSELSWSSCALDAHDGRIMSIVIDVVGPLHRLTRLCLDGNELADDGVVALAEVANKRRLTALAELVLSRNRIGNKGIAGLAGAMGVGAFESLRRLELEQNRIGGPGAKALAQALRTGKVAKLQRLSLADNRIGDEGCLSLAPALDYMERVQHTDIRLDRNEISEKGMLALLRSSDRFYDVDTLYGIRLGALSDAAIESLGLATA